MIKALKIATFIFAIALIYLLWSKIKSCNEAKRLPQKIVNLIPGKVDSGKYWQDQYNKEHLTVANLKSDINSLKATSEWVDQTKKELKIKDKQIIELTKQVLKASGNVQATLDTMWMPSIFEEDSVPVPQFTYTDEWTAISGKIINSKVDLSYSVDVPLNTTKYWKRRWFLGDKIGYMDASSPNPNVKIVGMTNVQISKKGRGAFLMGYLAGAASAGGLMYFINKQH